MENLTFSKVVKEELSHLELTKEEQIVQLKTVIYSVGTINFNSFQTTLEIKIANATIAKSIIKTLKREFPKNNLQIAVQKIKSFNQKKTIYIVSVLTDVNELLYKLGLIKNLDSKIIFGLEPFVMHLKKESLQRVYIRTFWILCGTINDPKKLSQYHLEFVNSNKEKLLEIQKILNDYDINFKISQRKSNYPLYLNKSEEIADFLKYIGSFNALFDFEDFRITRDFHNSINRMNNAEIANEMRKQKSIDEQIKAIQILYANGKLDELSAKTKRVAKLRLENPDCTLAELSNITNNEISKSNVSYHLNAIIKLSKGVEDE